VLISAWWAVQAFYDTPEGFVEQGKSVVQILRQGKKVEAG
jgi:hypothetical protein